MNPEEKQMLEETLELSQENHKMLKHIRRSQKMASIMRIFYWILVLIVSYGAYTFAQPYVDQMINIFQTSQTELNNIRNLGTKLPR
ncbi:MAG: hypothetical protein V4504_00730 [Patescibacteria group bacterium]